MSESEEECSDIPQGFRNVEKPGGLVASRSIIQSQHRAPANKCLPVVRFPSEFKLWICFQWATFLVRGGNKIINWKFGFLSIQFIKLQCFGGLNPPVFYIATSEFTHLNNWDINVLSSTKHQTIKPRQANRDHAPSWKTHFCRSKEEKNAAVDIRGNVTRVSVQTPGLDRTEEEDLYVTWRQTHHVPALCSTAALMMFKAVQHFRCSKDNKSKLAMASAPAEKVDQCCLHHWDCLNTGSGVLSHS